MYRLKKKTRRFKSFKVGRALFQAEEIVMKIQRIEL